MRPGVDVVGLVGQVGASMGRDAGVSAVALVLGIGRVAETLPEGVVGVVGGPGQSLRQGVQVQRLAQVPGCVPGR